MAFIFALTIVLTFLWSYTTNADTAGKEAPIFIKDGIETEFSDIKPFVLEPGITYVPASCCNKIFNSGFSYEITDETIKLIQKGLEYDTTLTAGVNRNTIFVNNKKTKIDYEPLTIDGEIYIPLRSIAEALGYKVYYNEIIYFDKAASKNVAKDSIQLNYILADVYIWNEDPNSSVDGIRYAVTQHNDSQTNITDIYNRKTSNKEDIFNILNIEKGSLVNLYSLYQTEGYRVPCGYWGELMQNLRDQNYNPILTERWIGDSSSSDMIILGIGENSDPAISSILKSMGEDNLRQNNGEVYRLSYFGTFSGNYVLRINLNSDGTSTVKYVYNLTLSRMDNTNEIQEKTLTKEETQLVTKKFSETDFWNMPLKVHRSGADGMDIIIEAVKDGNYHMAFRWTPVSGSFFELYEQLESLRINLFGEE